MKLRKSDIDLMLDIILDYHHYFERADNPTWYDKVESLRDKLDNILDSMSSKNTQKGCNKNEI